MTEVFICRHCDQRFLVARDHVDHEDNCPAKPVPDGRVVSFALARADKGSKPREHRPADALDLARAWLEEAGEENQSQHIIVFLGRTNSDNSSGTKYFQTGSFSCHAQVGLVIEGLEMLRDSGK